MHNDAFRNALISRTIEEDPLLGSLTLGGFFAFKRSKYQRVLAWSTGNKRGGGTELIERSLEEHGRLSTTIEEGVSPSARTALSV